MKKQNKTKKTVTYVQNHYNTLKNTLIFQQKYLKHTITLHFQELLSMKVAKHGPQIETSVAKADLPI